MPPTLTPQQREQYFREQGPMALPLSPLEWLAQQTSGNPAAPAARDVLSSEGALDAASLSTPPAPTLPTPQAPAAQLSFMDSLNANVESARATLDGMLKAEREAAKTKLDELKIEEKELLSKADTLTTPFRENLEKAERERLRVEENFFANQKLVGELEQLLGEGNALIARTKGAPLALSTLSKRSAKVMESVAARAGVIQAVISARSGQIAEAYRLIDRSVEAISADRQDRLAYYDALLDLNKNGQLSLEKDIKAFVDEEISLAKSDLARVEESVDYLKKLMIDPDTAQFIADAGVTLQDSIPEINAKMAEAAYAREVRDLSNGMAADGYTYLMPGQAVPAGAAVVTISDSKGVKKRYYKADKTAGTAVSAPTFAAGTELTSEQREQLKTAAIAQARTLASAGERDGAIEAISTFDTGQDIINMLAQVTTGPIAGTVRQGISVFGVPIVPGTRALGRTSEEQDRLASLMTVFTARFIKAISGAQVSDKEREFLMGALPTETKQEQANIQGIIAIADFLSDRYSPTLGMDLSPLKPNADAQKDPLGIGTGAEANDNNPLGI